MGQNKGDWRKQLADYGKQLREDMTPEERKKYAQEERERRQRFIEIDKRKPLLYFFLAGYKQDSGIFVNNFFRNRDYNTYLEDIFDIFTFDFQGQALPNVFDNPVYSLKMAGYLHELDEARCAYFPIDVNYIKQLIALAEVMELSEPLMEDKVFYRGCTNLDRNGVNGLVSVTSNFKIAEQFSRGTILTITIPKGTRMLNVNAVRPKGQRRKDFEQEYLLPPCDYDITSCRKGRKGEEPNNIHGETDFISLNVKPLDLLEEFLRSMQNSPIGYYPLQVAQEGEYEEAVTYLENYIERRKRRAKS